MGGSGDRKKRLVSASSLLISFLILLTLISSLQAQDERQCFICNGENSPKCKGTLTESDTALLKKCPVGRGSEGKSVGCKMYAIEPDKYAYPRVALPFWRDCLYEYELLKIYNRSRDHLTRPFTPGSYVNVKNFFIPKPWIKIVNEWRGKVGLLKLPNERSTYSSQQEKVAYFVLPTYHWNLSLSNGIDTKAATAFKRIYEEMEPRPMKSVKCFVCTDKDKGCDAKLDASSGSAFIQECKGSTETTVPIGCQIVAGQYEYPRAGAVYFYRDCFYENYLSCYMKKYEWKFDRMGRWLDCLNKVREYVDGLQPYPTSHLPDEKSKVHVALFHDLGYEITERAVAEHGVSPLDLGNGQAIADLKFEQRTPSDVKKKEPYQCYVCDSRQDNLRRRCDNPRQPPGAGYPQKCIDNERAYGCLTLAEVDSTGNAVWVRRECWYKGYLYCLKGLQPPAGRSGDNCPKPEDKCKARELIDHGHWLVWTGTKVLNGKNAYESFHSCVNKIRIREGVNDTLPPLPEFDIGTAEKVFRYYYCAGNNNCNDKATTNYFPYTTTSTTPKPPTPSPPGPPGGDDDECDDMDDDDCPDCPTCGAGFLLPNRMGMWSACLVFAIGFTFPRSV